ncbi:hypothetical protein [Halobacillus massiliensis]|uniref:hypothetical protein n=1 Tax=Halobacillus massiliensis TaxID=1926286 RepID=UPI001FEA5D14|nr:hypothetical protein [Halobacillus massiliensis]
MGPINIEDLKPYISTPVQVCIHGDQGEEMAPWVKKRIKKLALCPDKTHIRIYFDDFYFFAAPLTSRVKQTENEWSAYDQEAGLYFVIRSEENKNE